MNQVFEIKVKFNNKDLWKSALESYFSFNNLFLSFLGYSFFGLGLVLIFLRENFTLAHIADTFIAAGLFTVVYNFLMSYLWVNNLKTFDEKEFKFIFTSEEVKIIGELFSSNIKWKYFFRVKESRNYFALYMKSGQKQLIPKNVFESADLINFKNLLREKFGNEAYLKKTKGHLGLK